MKFRDQRAHITDDGLVIETVQDVSEIVDANRREYASYDERARWSDEPLGNKVASIPMTVIDDLNKAGIMRGFHVLDQAKFKAWLNNPDNRFFRTRPGRI